MKKSTLFRLSAIALSLCAGMAYADNNAQEFSKVVIFGDSLLDTGRLKDIATQVNQAVGDALQPSFTTNPDPVWTTLLANHYNKTAKPFTTTDQHGTNFAVGGARSGEDIRWNDVIQVPSTQTQIKEYLTTNGGKTDPNALYAVWIGSNDLIAAASASTTADAQTIITNAMGKTVTDITTLNQAGAKLILVPNIPDISLTPRAIFGETLQVGTQEKAKLATTLYNRGVYSALNTSTANVIPANTFALLQEAVANKEAFGFKNTNGVACQMPPRTRGADDPASTSLACTTAHLIESNAGETYVFADDIHPSGKTHRILAQYYRSIIDSPAQMGQLSQQILNTGSTNDRHLYRKLNQLSDDKHSVWADIHVGDDSPLTTVGMDIAGQNHHTGAYISHQDQDYQLSSTLNANAKNLGFGVYHRHDFNKLRLNANIGVDRLSLDSQRHIAWEGENRSHTADTTARRFHGGVQAGYAFDLNKIALRPYVGINAQKVSMDALTENNAQLSTAMQFGKQEINSLQGELGLDVGYAIAPNLTLTGGISHAHEFKDNQRTINATLLSMPEYARGFNVPVVSDKVHATTAHVGITSQLKSATVGVGAYAIHQDGKRDSDTQAGGKLSVAWKF